MPTILKTSQMKAKLGQILDKAVKRPQFVARKGHLLVIQKAGFPHTIPVRPAGFFADAYGDPERQAVEAAAFRATGFQPER